MVAKRDFIESQIADCENLIRDADAKISAAQRDKDIAQAQIDAFCLVLGQSSPRMPQDEHLPHISGRKAKRNRKPSGTWTAVLQEIATLKVATLDQIENFLADYGSPTERKNIRSQMSNYRKRGIIAEGTNNGQYSLTEEGYAQFAPPNANTTKDDEAGVNDGWLADIPNKNHPDWEASDVSH